MSLHTFIAAIAGERLKYDYYLQLVGILNTLWVAHWMLPCQYHLDLVLPGPYADPHANTKCYTELINSLKEDLSKLELDTKIADDNSAIHRIRKFYKGVLSWPINILIEELKDFGEYTLPENDFPQ